MSTTIAHLSTFLLKAQGMRHHAAEAQRRMLREPVLDTPQNRAAVDGVLADARYYAEHFGWLAARFPAANDEAMPRTTT